MDGHLIAEDEATSWYTRLVECMNSNYTVNDTWNHVMYFDFEGGIFRDEFMQTLARYVEDLLNRIELTLSMKSDDITIDEFFEEVEPNKPAFFIFFWSAINYVKAALIFMYEGRSLALQSEASVEKLCWIIIDQNEKFSDYAADDFRLVDDELRLLIRYFPLISINVLIKYCKKVALNVKRAREMHQRDMFDYWAYRYARLCDKITALLWYYRNEDTSFRQSAELMQGLNRLEISDVVGYRETLFEKSGLRSKMGEDMEWEIKQYLPYYPMQKDAYSPPTSVTPQRYRELAKMRMRRSTQMDQSGQSLTSTLELLENDRGECVIF